VHNVNKPANSRDDHSRPKCVFLWWIKIHGSIPPKSECPDFASSPVA
jgi:hypothetical protein